MGVTDKIIAGHIATLEKMAATWQAGYPLAREEFESLCKYEEQNIQHLEEYIERIRQVIEALTEMLKQAFAEMVSAKNALEAARARLRAAESGTQEERDAQAEVDRCLAAYDAARSRHLKIEEKKKEKVEWKATLEKKLEEWKEALKQFRRRGEEHLLELDRRNQQIIPRTNEAIHWTKEGKSLGA